VQLSTHPDVHYVSVQNKTPDRRPPEHHLGRGLRSVGPEQVYDCNSQGFLDSIDDVAVYNAPDDAPPEFRSFVPTQNRGGISPVDINADDVFLSPATVERRDRGQSGAVYVASLTVPAFNDTTAAPSERATLVFMTMVFNIRSLPEVTNDTMGLIPDRYCCWGRRAD